MASDIILMEGFEFYNYKKDLFDNGWSGNFSYNDPTDSSTRNNFSNLCLNLSGYSNDHYAQKSIPQQSTIYMGFAAIMETDSSRYDDNHFLQFKFNDYKHMYFKTVDDVEMPEALELYGPDDNKIMDFSGSNLVAGKWQFWEIAITIDDTNGSFLFKVDGETLADLTNINTKNTSADAYINNFRFVGHYVSGTKIDDLYISTSQLYGEISIGRIVPSGAGSNTDWEASSGDPYDCVNDAPFTTNTDKYIESDNPGDISTFDMSEISGIEDYHVISAKMYGVGERNNDLVPRSFKLQCLSNGVADKTAEVDMSYNDYVWTEKIVQENPDGNADWDWASLNAAEFGVELVS